MRTFGHRLSSFKVTKINNDKYYLSAPMSDSRGITMGLTERYYIPSKNILEDVE